MFATLLALCATNSSHESTSRSIRASVIFRFRACWKAMLLNHQRRVPNTPPTHSKTTCTRDWKCTRRDWHKSSAAREVIRRLRAMMSIRCRISSTSPCHHQMDQNHQIMKWKSARSSSQSSGILRRRMRRYKRNMIDWRTSKRRHRRPTMLKRRPHKAALAKAR